MYKTHSNMRRVSVEGDKCPCSSVWSKLDKARIHLCRLRM
jgi:hypothetical protein